MIGGAEAEFPARMRLFEERRSVPDAIRLSAPSVSMGSLAFDRQRQKVIWGKTLA